MRCRDFIIIIMIVVVLTVVAARASYVEFDYTHTINYSTNTTATTQYQDVIECPANLSQAQNVTINATVTYPFSYKCVLTNTTKENVTLTHFSSKLVGDGITVYLNNENRSQTLLVESTDEYYVRLRFFSNYILPETLRINLYGKNHSFTVVGNTDIYVPITIDYDEVNWSDVVDNTVNLSLGYEVIGTNFSGDLEFDYKHEIVPEITLINDGAQYRVNDLILEKLVIETRVPIKNVTLESDKELISNVLLSPKQAIVYITPKEVGEYRVKYVVEDYFGNTNNVTSVIQVLPIGTVFFSSYTIPEIEVGERTRFQIFEHDTAFPVNYTLVSFGFVPENETLFQNLNLSVRETVDLFLSDDVDNNYFTEINKTVVVTRSKTFMNIKPMLKGNLSLKYMVAVPKDVTANKEFLIWTRVGDESVFNKQEIDVGGTIVTCELDNSVDWHNANRKCWVEFPLQGNLNNDMVLLSARDYEHYQQSHQLELETLGNDKDAVIKNRENWMLIFIFVALVLLVLYLWSLYPRDWLIYRNTNKK